MNAKILFAFVLAVNICIIAVTAQVYSYSVSVKTADKEFSSHDGKIKISVLSSDSVKTSQEDFVLTPNDIEIKKDETYNYAIPLIAPLENITSVYLRWTLASPYNPYYEIKKPKIYFDSVTLVSTYIVPFIHQIGSKKTKFCPETIPIGIEHADGATFNPCT